MFSFRLSEKEYARLKANSLQAKLPVSIFCRNVIFNYSMSNRFKVIYKKDLFKVNADLARLGNLLKLCVDNRVVDIKEVKVLLNDINMARKILVKKILAIKI